MKFAAYIFITIIGMLTLQPGFTNSPIVTERQCCSRQGCGKTNTQNQGKNDNGSNGCNPFMACPVSSLYLLEKSFCLSVPQTAVKQKFITDNDNRLSTNIAEFWRPPENG